MKLTSTNYSANTMNVALLILRAGVAGLLFAHGYDKLMHFSEYSKTFMNFMGLGNDVSFGLLVFAEFFCSLLVIFGLFTRAACIPPIIAMLVAVFKAHNGDIFGEAEHAFLFVIGFVTIFLTGPGRFSVDGMIK